MDDLLYQYEKGESEKRRLHAELMSEMCIRDRSTGLQMPAPVSYTHLDVYKRQPLERMHKPTCCEFLARGLRNIGPSAMGADDTAGER